MVPLLLSLCVAAPSDDRLFVERLTEAHDLLHQHAVARPTRRRLAELSLRGLYAGRGETVPTDLAARLKESADDDLPAVLRDGYRRVAAWHALDAASALDDALAYTLRSLDPHAAWRPVAPHLCHREPQFGIGVRLRLDAATQQPVIVTPLKDGPAYRAGLRAGDRLTHITRPSREATPNNATAARPVATSGLGLPRVEALLTGEADTPLVLMVEREGVAKPWAVALANGGAAPEAVLGWRRKDDDTWDHLIDRERKLAYVRLPQFTRRTKEEVGRVLDDLEKQGVRGVVLDLRFCPGGLLASAVAVAEQFIERGVLVTIRPVRGKDYVGRAEGGQARKGLAVACLVNGDTKSGAELLAAALQDHGRSVVVGERTAGRAAVQNIERYDDRELVLTTAVFFRPGGAKLDRVTMPCHDADEWGVTPDEGHSVRLKPEEKAALEEHLDRRTFLHRRDAPAKEPPFEDRQLRHALDLLARKTADR